MNKSVLAIASGYKQSEWWRLQEKQLDRLGANEFIHCTYYLYESKV